VKLPERCHDDRHESAGAEPVALRAQSLQPPRPGWCHLLDFPFPFELADESDDPVLLIRGGRFRIVAPLEAALAEDFRETETSAAGLK
jgi:hypothetical protein